MKNRNKMIPLKILEIAVDCYNAKDSKKIETVAKGIGKTAVSIGAESVAIPTAIAVSKAIGATASTGTAISTLSGAAATNATLAGIGAHASAVIGTLGITVAPMVVGGAIVCGVAAGLAWGFNKLFLDD